MDFYECLQLLNWKKLTDEEKETIFAGVLKFFVNPKLSLDWQQLVNFEMCGMKCRTFEIMLSGEKYVFIPGQKEVVLGWDFGSQGLKTHELLELDQTDHLSETNQFKTSLTAAELAELAENNSVEPFYYDFQHLAEIDRYINDHTSPLRKVDIPPMLVAKEAQPVGTSVRGIYNSVSGQFAGDEHFWSEVEKEITQVFNPQLSISESLSWTYPNKVLKSNHFYLEQLEENDDHYRLYAHKSLNYGELWLLLHHQGFQLLSEDAWEYAVGGGTRRLFRWGNELNLTSNHPFLGIGQKAEASNMFGIYVDASRTSYELTDDSQCVKLANLSEKRPNLIENILPLSSYYQPNHPIEPSEALLPDIYQFRKSICIQPN